MKFKAANWCSRFVLLILLASCQTQQKPTEVKESKERLPIESVYSVEEPIIIGDSSVMLDVRPLFEYSTAHLEGSISIQAKDFAQIGSPGVPQQDLDQIARRLAVMGISPQTPVVVVGQGTSGQGEQGWMAWLLNYLGVEDVSTAPVSYFDGPLTTKTTDPLENAPFWQASPDESLLVSRKELLAAVARPKGDQAVVIDVRDAKEYLKGTSGERPDIGAINVPWSEFFDDQGRPEVGLIPRLQGVGITTDKRIIVISEKGLRSAAVTKALRELGFAKAGNFVGGYTLLMQKK